MSIQSEEKLWKEQVVDPILEKFKERKPEFTSPSGIPLPRVGLPVESNYMDSLGFPGEYPLLPAVYSRPCTAAASGPLRQYAGFASAEESNQRYRYLLEQGQTGLSVAFVTCRRRLATMQTTPCRWGRWERLAFPFPSLRDMEILFNQIPSIKFPPA